MSIPFRVGQGFDVHALVEGRPLIIGGVLYVALILLHPWLFGAPVSLR